MEIQIGRHQLKFTSVRGLCLYRVTCQIMDKHGDYNDLLKLNMLLDGRKVSYHKCRNTALDLNEFYEIITVMKGLLENEVEIS